MNQVLYGTSKKNEISIFCTVGAVEDQPRSWTVNVGNGSSAQRNNIILSRHGGGVASVKVKFQLNAKSVGTYFYITHNEYTVAF